MNYRFDRKSRVADWRQLSDEDGILDDEQQQQIVDSLYTEATAASIGYTRVVWVLAAVVAVSLMVVAAPGAKVVGFMGLLLTVAATIFPRLWPLLVVSLASVIGAGVKMGWPQLLAVAVVQMTALILMYNTHSTRRHLAGLSHHRYHYKSN